MRKDSALTEARVKPPRRESARRNQKPADGTRLGDEAARRVEAWLLHERRRREVFAPSGQTEAVEEAGGGRFEYAYDRRGDLT